MESQLMNEVKGLATGTMDSTVNYMNLGFTLASALAWHESAKMIIKQFVTKSNGKSSAMVVYPLAVTLLAVLVFRMTKVVSPNTKKPIVVPVVSA